METKCRPIPEYLDQSGLGDLMSGSIKTFITSSPSLFASPSPDSSITNKYRRQSRHPRHSVAKSWDKSQFWGFLKVPSGFFLGNWENPKIRSLLKEFFSKSKRYLFALFLTILEKKISPQVNFSNH